MKLILTTIGGISIYEIIGKHKINIINDHFYYIETFDNATKSLYSGGINMNCNKLSTSNILHSYINVDYPTSEDRMNGFYKIEYICMVFLYMWVK